jgi:hypothetical protein
MADSKDININIDGNDVTVPEGTTVLEAAREAGIYVPTLCNHPDLPPYGACRLCICEIEGMRGYPTSCTLPATDGMKVRTDTDKLKELRREVLTLLLEKHPHACLTCAQREGCTREPCSTNVPVEERCCPQFGNCELQQVVEYVGIREDTPRYTPPGKKVFDDEPLVHRDYNLCILCGRCVSACNDLRGNGILGFIERGHEAEVRTAFDRSFLESDCMFCTTCVEVCPTGALRDKDLEKGPKEEVLVPCRSTCPAGVDVPRFLYYLRNGRSKEALAVLFEKLPIPYLLAFACDHPCEDKCRRGKVNEAVAINELERWLVKEATGFWDDLSRPARTGRKVAILGAGPTGLGVAFLLAMKGHEVHIMEVGGDLLELVTRITGRPVPHDIIEKQIEALEKLGVNMVSLTEPRTHDAIKAQGFDALLVADDGQAYPKEVGTSSGDWVFLGGMASKGKDLVRAVPDSREVAGKMDSFLGGDGSMSLALAPEEDMDPRIGRVKGFGRLPRAKTLDSPEVAVKEASRCLRCALRLTISKVPLPPETLLALNEENLAKVPGTEGVYTLMDSEKNVLAIKGVDDLAGALTAFLAEPGKVSYFDFEEDKMYSKREAELLQQYIQKHGKMPEGAGGEDDLDDLF